MPGSKRVRLYIDSDSSGVQKGISGAQRELKGFERSALHTQGIMKGLGSTAGTLGLTFGAAGLAFGLRNSIDAFKDMERQNARTVAQLKNLGINTEAVRKKIEETTAAQSKMSGFQEHDLKASFATLLTSTHSVTGALNLNVTAMNLARLRQIDMGTAAKVLGKVVDGNVGILNRYGIHIEKGTSVTEALRLVQQKAAGQAKEFGATTAGASDKANASFTQLEEKIGSGLAPALNQAASATLSFTSAAGHLVDTAGGLGPVLSGAGGFGAFRLIAPEIGSAGGKLKELGAISRESGGGLKGFGSAASSLVSPMGAAAVGAGLLAAGIYEIWHNSENAEQAVSGLNSRLKDVSGARDQVTIAKDNVKASQDYVKTARDAVVVAREHAAALHADVVQLKEHKGSTSQVDAATKRWQKAMQDIVPLMHTQTAAEHQLIAAHKNVQTASDGVSAAQEKVASKIRDVISKAHESEAAIAGTSRRNGVYERQTLGAAGATSRLARTFEDAARAAHGTDTATSRADTTIARVIRTIGRVPTVKEFHLITNLASQNRAVDAIVQNLARLHDKQVTVRFNQTFGSRVNPLTGLKRSGGGMVPGSYSQGDIHPAMLSGQEAVLNPKQIGMVDSGMTVIDALNATGAPTDGGFYAPGKKPNPYHYPRSNLTGVKRTTKTPSEQAQAAIAARQEYFGLQIAKSDQALANAQGTDTIDDDLLAYSADTRSRKAYRDWLGRVLRDPGKTLGFPGARLSARQRTDLINEQTAQTRAMNDDAAAAFQLLHQDTGVVTNASGVAVDANGNPIGVDTGPTPDQQAQLDQKQRQIDVLTRSNQLSGAALSGFGSSGDIGTGQFANAYDAARGGPTLVLADARSLAAVANAATQGMGNQASISSNAASVRI